MADLVQPSVKKPIDPETGKVEEIKNDFEQFTQAIQQKLRTQLHDSVHEEYEASFKKFEKNYIDLFSMNIFTLLQHLKTGIFHLQDVCVDGIQRKKLKDQPLFFLENIAPLVAHLYELAVTLGANVKRKSESEQRQEKRDKIKGGLVKNVPN